ncbi:2-C-methyl-D-erythritol 2,4-cyclodiphosphate synthase [Candidatus Bipolaricaulota bacterium]
MSEHRVGLGIDLHRFSPDRPLVLGGVSVPHTAGLLGHSDADVLTHAICDALLGAAGLGDIGTHFPDSDEAYRGASSIGLLAEVVEKLAEAGFRPLNVDATVIAESPKMTPHFAEMKARLAETLRVAVDRVGLKATTSEGMGALGRGEGIAALAVALIGRAQPDPCT